ncbi:MAG: DUF998 domain-containing protein [Pseudomonadota bacterium]
MTISDQTIYNERSGAGRKLDPLFLIVMGWAGLAGCAILILGTIVAPWFVPHHDWVADTISDLAAGEWEIIMDVSLYAFAAGLFCLALGAAHAHPGGKSWSLGVVSLGLLAALVTIIAARNEYGDGDSEGVEIHIYLVYGLGLLFFAAPLLLARGTKHFVSWARPALIILGSAWAAAAPLFFLLPNSVDGLYERALGILSCAILAVLCSVFIGYGRRVSAGQNASTI